jgi:uncharacterized protein YjbI with pentapeptide repeats
MESPSIITSIQPVHDAEFYNCRFEHCDLTALSAGPYEFHDCVFSCCNCVPLPFDDTMFDGVRFEECKLTGVNFSNVNKFLFTASFHKCALDYAIFKKSNLIGTLFSGCSIRDASFIDSALKSAVFEECDLKGTVFERCGLEKADFTSASGYFIDLDINKVKGARFSLPEAANLLLKYDIKLV